MCIEYQTQVNTYHVSTQSIDECMTAVCDTDVHYYYYYKRGKRHNDL